MRRPQLRPGGPKSGRTTAHERQSIRHIAIFDLGPAAIDRSHPTPVGEALLAGDRSQLVCPPARGCRVSYQYEQRRDQGQARCYKQRISQPLGGGECCVALCQSLARKTETEKDDTQRTTAYHLGLASGQTDKRAVGDRIIKRKR